VVFHGWFRLYSSAELSRLGGQRATPGPAPATATAVPARRGSRAVADSMADSRYRARAPRPRSEIVSESVYRGQDFRFINERCFTFARLLQIQSTDYTYRRGETHCMIEHETYCVKRHVQNGRKERDQPSPHRDHTVREKRCCAEIAASTATRLNQCDRASSSKLGASSSCKYLIERCVLMCVLAPASARGCDAHVHAHASHVRHVVPHSANEAHARVGACRAAPRILAIRKPST
jgi:hypothetical protein